MIADAQAFAIAAKVLERVALLVPAHVKPILPIEVRILPASARESTVRVASAPAQGLER